MKKRSIASPGILCIAVIVCFLAFVSHNLAFAQWEQVSNGIWSGVIPEITEVNGRLFAATYGGGLYKSDDNGSHWYLSINGNSEPFPACIVGANQDLYMSGSKGLYHSSDNGDNWTVVDTGSYSWGKLDVKGDTIIAIYNQNNIYRSLDNGVTWVPVTNSNLGNYIYSVALIGNSMIAGTSNGLYLSSNGGLNWTLQANDTWVHDFAVFHGKIYAVGAFVYSSEDQGYTWTQIYDGSLMVGALNCVSVNQYRVLVGCNYLGVLSSSDEGQNWTLISSGLPNLHISSLCDKGDSFFAGSRGGGVFVTDFPYNTWHKRSVGIINAGISALGDFGNTIFCGTTPLTYQTIGSTIYRSQDNSNSWQQCDSGLPAEYNRVSCFTQHGNKVIAGIMYSGVFLSSDNGDSWENISNGISNNTIGVTSSSGKLFVAQDDDLGLVQSLDTGISWTVVPGLVTQYPTILKSYSDTIYYGAYDLQISYDGGQAWNTSFYFPHDLIAIAAQGNLIFAKVFNHGIYRSFNYGLSWAPCNNGIPISSVSKKGEILIYGNRVFVEIQSSIYCSQNNGNNWFCLSDTFLCKTVISMMIKDNYLYAGTYFAGLWRKYIGPATIVAESHSIEQPFLYPNPTQNYLNISWKVIHPNTAYKIFDFTGQLLQCGNLQVADKQQIYIEDLPDGMYFLRVQDQVIQFTQKFIKLN